MRCGPRASYRCEAIGSRRDILGQVWRHRICLALAYVLIFVGVAPLLYTLGWCQTHSLVPLKVPLPVSNGEYVFPFKVKLDSYYRIQVRANSSAGYHPEPCSSGVDGETCHKVVLNWKILTDSGDVVKEGAFTTDSYLPGGESQPFDAKRGSHLRLNLTIHREVNSARPAHAQLSVEEGSGVGEGIGLQLELGVVWALFVAGGGMALLSFLRH